MIRKILNILLLFILFIIGSPVYSIDFSEKAIEKYTLKISKKFANTYCNSIKFGITEDSALKFSIGETNKEFSNNKLNEFIDYELLNINILLNLENNCKIFDLSEHELESLKFRY